MTLPVNKKTFKNLFPPITIDGIKLQDLWRAWVLTEEFKDKIKIFGTYYLYENARWDTVAEEVYGDRELWWVVMLFNAIEDPFTIYYDKSIPDSIKTLKMPREEDIGIILDEIRRIRVNFETTDEEETV